MYTAVNNSISANSGTNRYTVHSTLHKSKKALHHSRQKKLSK